MKLLVETASTLLGLDEAELVAPCTPESHENAGVAHHAANGGPSPLWREIDRITVRASRAGVVETLALANGAWASETSLVLSIVQPDQVRFRARGMQSDLGRLAKGLPARIVPPAGGSLDVQHPMEGELVIGLAADPEERTVELLVTPRRLSAWARPGVSAFLEVLVAGGQPALAVPASAVVQDGLEHVVFRRDPTDPDSVLRVPAELGVSDGRWVVVKRGVQPGDEVVLDGVYQLMLATSGAAQPGGHFDPDGTFHTGKH
jgi:Cu(I)/Ag(I) efflux system membrane fusion protein